MNKTDNYTVPELDLSIETLADLDANTTHSAGRFPSLAVTFTTTTA